MASEAQDSGQASPPSNDESPPAPPADESPASSPENSSTTPDQSPPAPPSENSPTPNSSPGPTISPSGAGEGHAKTSNSSSSSSSSGKALSPPSTTSSGKSSHHTPSSSSSSSSSDNNNDLKVGLAVGGVVLFAYKEEGVTMLIRVVPVPAIAILTQYGVVDEEEDETMATFFLFYCGDNRYYNKPPNPNWQNGTSQAMGYSSGPGGQPGGWGAASPQSHMMNQTNSGMESGPHGPILPPPSPNYSLGYNQNTFAYDELAVATGNFCQENMVGQGGFGYVHKGVLPNGKEIAVKSLKSGSGQGEREFQAEVDIISRVHHRYLVSLVGYCIAGGQRMLVYEFVPNNTLEHHLHGKGLPVMEFSTRLKIALGSAKGLAYLHEDCHPRIIHRDIKSANILLDFSFEAKVADFGLAKLSSDNYTHVSTRVMGTFGYLAPEYAASGKLTEKSDVFSFGVMLLELITGRRPVDPHSNLDDSLVDWARPIMARSLTDGNFDEIADPLLERNYNREEMARMVASAAAAIRHSAKKRPRMSQIVRALEGESSLDDLNEGVKPGQSTIYGLPGSADYSQSSYQSDLKKFKDLALSSGELTSSDFGGSSTATDSREMGPNRHL
ncbi:hypothetical protein ACFE04_001644 [Oxalis oulophora]